MKIETFEIILLAAHECLGHFRIITDPDDGQIQAKDEVDRLLDVLEREKAGGATKVAFQFETPKPKPKGVTRRT